MTDQIAGLLCATKKFKHVFEDQGREPPQTGLVAHSSAGKSGVLCGRQVFRIMKIHGGTAALAPAFTVRTCFRRRKMAYGTVHYVRN
jgi:hypothetical protein